MVFHRMRRTAAWAGLCGALALVAPAGAASAKTHGQPTPMTVTPAFAETLAPAVAASAGLVEVAQNFDRRQRAADRRQFRRERAASRREFRRDRADRRQFHRQERAYARRDARRDRAWHNGRWYYHGNDGFYYDNTGAAVAAGIIGLAAGAILGSALTAPPTVVYEDRYYGRGVPAPYTADWYRQCDRKYRSFRASDGTYLGYDGLRHLCRLP